MYLMGRFKSSCRMQYAYFRASCTLPFPRPLRNVDLCSLKSVQMMSIMILMCRCLSRNFSVDPLTNEPIFSFSSASEYLRNPCWMLRKSNSNSLISVCSKFRILSKTIQSYCSITKVVKYILTTKCLFFTSMTKQMVYGTRIKSDRQLQPQR